MDNTCHISAGWIDCNVFFIIVIAMETAEISTLRLPLTRRRIYALVLVKRTLSPVGATGVTVRLDLERQVTTRRSYDQAYAQLVQPAPGE